MLNTTGEEEYQGYFRKVELGWSLARGCQIIVSPLEFEEIEKWHTAGIPLPVVLHAIDVFIEKKRKSKRAKGYLLKDATGTVEKCWKEYKDIHAGEGEEGDLLANKMKTLTGKVKKLAKAWPAQAGFLATLTSELQALPIKDIVDFDSIDTSLADLEKRLLAHFISTMPPDELVELRDEVSEFLSEEEDPDFFAKLLSDAIRGHFGIPKLTLLG